MFRFLQDPTKHLQLVNIPKENDLQSKMIQSEDDGLKQMKDPQSFLVSEPVGTFSFQ